MEPDYEMLKAYGHSPTKAAEIILGAARGDFFCKQYIALIRTRQVKASPTVRVGSE